MMETKTKILVGIPGYNGIVPEAQQSIMQMIFTTGRQRPAWDVAVGIVTKREQFRARNQLVDQAIGGDFDWLLMLDDDMLPPADLLIKLVEHQKPVCGGLYYQRGGAYHPVLLNRTDTEEGLMATSFLSQVDERLTNPGLHRVDIIGGGCMLFQVDVFRKLQQPYFEWERSLGTDIAICVRLADAGVEIWADTSLECGHLRDEKQVITSRSIPLAERLLATINDQLYKDARDYLCMADEQLQSAMVQACAAGQHHGHWDASPRGTDDEIAEYYRANEEWHIANLLSYNLHNREVTKEWVLRHADNLCNAGDTVIDYGAGLGHLAVPLAARGYHVAAVDLENAATLKFLRHRKKKHQLDHLTLLEAAPVPDYTLPKPAKLAYCISTIEHLTYPWEALAWMHANMAPGAYLVCSYACDRMENEPQHLIRYDVSTFESEMHKRGWVVSPEFPWLFIRR